MAEKKYRGAPFGTQTARFDVSAVHPQNKLPGTYTQVPYCKKATSTENQLLGPGTYSIETGCFTPRAIYEKSRGPNWARAFEVARWAAIPHVLHKDEWKLKRQLTEQLGPGRYQIKNFIEDMNSKPSSSRGVCQSLDARIGKENKFHSNLPGPGTYGVPWATSEDKRNQSTSTVGMLEGGGARLKAQPMTGSDLSPGQYKYASSIEQLLNKTISKRGPYDLFTGDRHKYSKALMQKRHLCPGRYDLKSFTADMEDHHHEKQGQFSSMPQYPELPTERIYCSTLSQWPRRKEDPGPGHYGLQHSRTMSAPPSRHPFSSSAERFNKRSQLGSTNPVGAGQYDILRWKKAQPTNGNISVFTSRTPRLPPKVDAPREQLLNERIHPKGISLHKRTFHVSVEALN